MNAPTVRREFLYEVVGQNVYDGRVNLLAWDRELAAAYSVVLKLQDAQRDMADDASTRGWRYGYRRQGWYGDRELLANLPANDPRRFWPRCEWPFQVVANRNQRRPGETWPV